MMKKYLILLLIIGAVAVSCSTDENRLSLMIPDKDAQIAELEFITDATPSPFYYQIQAGEVIIDWGDKSRPTEYVYRGKEWKDIINIKPIQYIYQKQGRYSVNIRTGSLYAFDFSKGIDGRSPGNSISSIDFSNCIGLKKLYCKNQPISHIDLTKCLALETVDFSGSKIQTIDINNRNGLKTFRIDSTLVPAFDCSFVLNAEELGIGNADKQQIVSNINQLVKLKKLIVVGNINLSTIDMTRNDSIHSVKAVNTNIREFNLSGLSLMDSVSFEQCKVLNKIHLKGNSALKHIVLKNNQALDAKALNDIFGALPQVAGTDKTIVLTGNAGDEACDRTIATRKGWVIH